MKNTTIWISIAIVGLAAIFYSFSGEATDYPSGAPAGYTGSPGDGQNCTSCHGGTASNVTGWITSNIPASGYSAGNSYTITVTLTGVGKKGFEVSPQDPAGNLLGTLIPGPDTELKGSGKYITHSSAPTTNPMTWTFTWTAPAAGTGTVTFYGAFTVNMPVTKLSTLTVDEAAAPLTAQATATPSTITAGESSQLSVDVTGGTGTYTYSWTSVPAGFTSNLQSPVVSPLETTTYNVTVTSGTQTANSSATVTVNQPIPLTVIATATPSSILPGESSQLNASPSGGSGTYSYSWTSSPAGFTSNIQNPVVTPVVTTIYTVAVNDGVNTSSDDVEVTVSLNPLTADATATPGTICEGETSQLNVTASGGSGTYSYSWTSVPPGFTSNLQNPVVQPVINTQYIATVTDGTQNATSSADVTVIPSPTVSAGNDTMYCENVTQFPVSGTAGSYVSSSWSTSGDGVFADPASLITVYSPGSGDISTGSVDLTLTVTPVAPCSSPASSSVHILFDPCTGIPSDNDGNVAVKLFPNPTTGPVRILAEGPERISADVTVYDSRGIVVYSGIFTLSGNISGSLDLTGYPQGMYFVRVQAGPLQKTIKLVLM